ncbi:MAG TPA: AAA family ATPase, partial [Polyangiaceae bacterium]|nr:AAA family ATPase [Polyangiaceae bacterium]
EVNRGRFREDLYFRLSVISVRLPPLRERLEDIPVLVNAFLEEMDATSMQHLFTDPVYRELAQHDWPGNVRELRNYVERALVLEDVGPASLSPNSRRTDSTREAPDSSDLPKFHPDEPFKVAKERLISRFERAYLEGLMAWAGGNVSRAARKAKIDRMYLYRLLQRYEMRRDNSPEPPPDSPPAESPQE